MSTFRPGDSDRSGEDASPTTPRPSTAPHPHPGNRMDDSTTPTRANFGALATQRALPAEPLPTASSMTEDVPDPPRREKPPYPAPREGEDVEMDGSDESGERSDDESLNTDDTGKKKKSQRFYCTDYPPCNLSFTRSEHLARHIRKHTGERPFQCHCSRRFSRLDNLRQHAQTVHVNEDIPIDSLAATGARFQRQVRTDRVRPPGVRSRAATSGSQAGPIRGHQRNSLSASSIASVGSIGSAYSLRDDARRRPAPLVMAGANRHSAEMMYHPDSPGNYPFRARSPVGFSTPTSATFSTGQNSPRWPPGLQSPISSHSRTQSLYSAPRTPGRRLSVPSAGYPYQSPRGGSYGQHPVSLNSPMTSSPGSILSSPTSIWSRRDSTSSATDETYKRKTWAHPETYSSFASRLQNPISTHYPSPGPPPRGALEQSNGPSEQGRMRLPGIESFDSIPRSATPVQRQPSPMVIDTPSRAPIPSSEPYREGVRDTQPWEMGAPRYPDRLDIGRGSSSSNDSAAAWASEANWAVQARAEQARAPPSQVRFEESSYLERTQRVYQHQSAPVVTPREAKRQAWYHGPVSAHHQQPPVDPQLQRTSPEGSSSSDGVPGTPSSTNARDSNPSIMHSNGYVESRDSYPVHDPRSGSTHDLSGYANYPPTNGPDASYTYAHGHQAPQVEPQHQVPKASDSSMLRLEALVAVATSEENVAAAAY